MVKAILARKATRTFPFGEERHKNHSTIEISGNEQSEAAKAGPSIWGAKATRVYALDSKSNRRTLAGDSTERI